MVHELGHTIGFRHTNWQAIQEDSFPDHPIIGAVQIPGTPQSDAASVMNGGPPTAWSGFSPYDIIAAKTMYPPTLAVAMNGLYEIRQFHGCWWTTTVTGLYPPYTYEWTLTKGGPAAVVGTDDWYEIDANESDQDFFLSVGVTDSLGRTRFANRMVEVRPNAPTPWEWCN